jgi:hypothetical protein
MSTYAVVVMAGGLTGAAAWAILGLTVASVWAVVVLSGAPSPTRERIAAAVLVAVVVATYAVTNADAWYYDPRYICEWFGAYC